MFHWSLGGGRRERNIDVRKKHGLLPPLGTQMRGRVGENWTATQVYALTRNRPRNPLVQGRTLQPTERAWLCFHRTYQESSFSPNLSTLPLCDGIFEAFPSLCQEYAPVVSDGPLSTPSVFLIQHFSILCVQKEEYAVNLQLLGSSEFAPLQSAFGQCPSLRAFCPFSPHSVNSAPCRSPSQTGTHSRLELQFHWNDGVSGSCVSNVPALLILETHPSFPLNRYFLYLFLSFLSWDKFYVV